MTVTRKEDNWACSAATAMGCIRIKLPITYLGVPLDANMKRVSSWQGIIDKVQKRLTSWKSSCLSRAGRIVLIKSVLDSLPIYYLSLFKMPKKVAYAILKIQRVLWCGEKEGKFMALLSGTLYKNRSGQGACVWGSNA